LIRKQSTRQRLVNDRHERSRRRRLLDRCEIAAAHDRQADRLEIAAGDDRVGWHHALVAALTRPHDPPTLVALAARYLRARADIRDAGHSAQPGESISQSHPSPGLVIAREARIDRREQQPLVSVAGIRSAGLEGAAREPAA